jgi:hypothetical protein
MPSLAEIIKGPWDERIRTDDADPQALDQVPWELQENGELTEAIHGAASLAQAEIDRLMKQGYQEHEAREVALREFVLLSEEPAEDDEQARELAAMEETAGGDRPGRDLNSE